MSFMDWLLIAGLILWAVAVAWALIDSGKEHIRTNHGRKIELPRDRDERLP